MGKKEAGPGQPDDRTGKPGGFRVPPTLMIPVGFAVGWLVGDLLGAVLGGVIGVFLWRSRS
jgi:hypothetical protein